MTLDPRDPHRERGPAFTRLKAGRAPGGVALLATALGLTACGDPGAPNGDKQVLFFEPEYTGRIAENFSESITLPRHVTLGDTPKSVSRIEHYDYDFDGTALEFPDTVGLTVRDTTLDAVGWHVTLSCSGSVSGSAKLHVLVRAGTRAQYEDTTSVNCGVARALDVAPLGPPTGEPAFSFAHYILGAATDAVTVALLDESGVPLAGHGLSNGSVELNPASSPGDDQLSDIYWFTPTQAGPATLLAGGVPFQLPFDVVGDDNWNYELSTLPDAGSGPLWSVSARLADGTIEPVAQSCTLNATASDGTSALLSFGSCVTPVLPGHGELCITIRSKTGCVPY